MGYFRILTVRNYTVGFNWGFQGLDSSAVNFRYVCSIHIEGIKKR
ncbi:hypothetical protein BT246_36380 [Bacillus thuringiensis]|uniref:Uncharacterized protein n=1 Tax=Bacillus thuringiensis TaxID=1428 RepID=A0A9W3SDF9_BACTU|nr:hypothetical protein BT246_36380 [Bacillus thuringiensis]